MAAEVGKVKKEGVRDKEALKKREPIDKSFQLRAVYHSANQIWS